MKIDVIRIGNSRGIRIPKPILEQCGLGDTAELTVERGRLVISRDEGPRAGWEEAFKAASSEFDELLLERVPPNEFDREEWEW